MTVAPLVGTRHDEAMTATLETVFVIGMGEVGTRLAQALGAAGVPVVPVTRTAGWDRATSSARGLRLICVREEALAEVLIRLSDVPSDRLVTVQNGWIQPLLEDHPNSTRGLIWFTSKGDFFRELRPSPFAGPAALTLTSALERGGVSVRAVTDAHEFARLDADKMGFNAVVGLPLAVHGVTLGTYLSDHRTEAESVFTEAVTVCARALGIAPDDDWWPSFVSSVEPLSWVSASKAKALEFRNGAVQTLGRELGIRTPVTDRLLTAAGWGDPS